MKLYISKWTETFQKYSRSIDEQLSCFDLSLILSIKSPIWTFKTLDSFGTRTNVQGKKGWTKPFYASFSKHIIKHDLLLQIFFHQHFKNINTCMLYHHEEINANSSRTRTYLSNLSKVSPISSPFFSFFFFFFIFFVLKLVST